ncbi:hypothetical protein VTJ83DRAFT_3632 [Remersonia thermophila]|uniref:Rhodopsin domain-containing protein n=1 Tax=Remersonia thermophila TaxID=72144 RepID=A0ABR4DEK7_9PEZI
MSTSTGTPGAADGPPVDSPSAFNATDVPPPIPDIPITPHAARVAVVHIALTSTLLLLCLIAFVMRMYRRITPAWRVGADDVLITLGFALTVTDFALLLPTAVPTPGNLPVSASIDIGKYSWIAISVWGLSMTCIKLSVALTLLRVRGEHLRWKIFLYTVMTVQAAYGFGNVLFNLVIACQPLEAAWNFALLSEPGSTAKCVSYETMRTVSNVGSSINIATDLLLSLAPATFLRRLNRPLRERIFVCVLMGMGLMASGASVAKTVVVQGWGDFSTPPDQGNDWWATSVEICTWTMLEQELGLLAACIPALKGLLQSCLGAMGVSLTVDRTKGTGTSGARRGRWSTARGVLPTSSSQKGDGLGGVEMRRMKKGATVDEEARVEAPETSPKWLQVWPANSERMGSTGYLLEPTSGRAT